MLERSSHVPLYHQLKSLLADKIRRGEWKAGDLIPAESELQARFDLSRTTVRLALRELETQGTLVRQRGRGTFVARPKLTHDADPSVGLANLLESQGLSGSWRVVAIDWVDPPPTVRSRLGLADGARAYAIKRVRLVNDEPIGVHVAHVAPAFADAIDQGALSRGTSLEYLVHHVALQGAIAERLIDVTTASSEDAPLLDVAPETPLLRIQRLVHTRSGEAIEDCTSVYRGDRFQYHVRGAAIASDRHRE